MPAAHAPHFVVVPAGQPVFDRLADFSAPCRVFQARHDFRRSAFEVLGRQALLEARHSGDIRILVGGDVHAAVACLLNESHLLLHAPPIGFRVHLEVQDVDRQSGAFADADGLADGADSSRSLFTADMAGVDAAVFRRDFGQLNQLLCGGEHVGRVHQTR